MHLVISLLLEVVLIAMGHGTSRYRIIWIISGSTNESLFVYMVGFWPIMAFGALLVSVLFFFNYS